MPKKEEYGAQPPIELLRQWMDHQGWYDLKPKDKPFMKIEDIIFVCAMGPPGGGRSPLTKRLERHFNILTYTNLDKDSISMIFCTILKHFVGSFTPEINDNINALVDSTQKVYNFIASTLKPTPTKSHYTFNLRDISKIFQGVCSADRKSTTQMMDVIRLWIHENIRVFGDRMVSTEDRETLNDMLNGEA
jgi:dynein heavy chain